MFVVLVLLLGIGVGLWPAITLGAPAPAGTEGSVVPAIADPGWSSPDRSETVGESTGPAREPAPPGDPQERSVAGVMRVLDIVIVDGASQQPIPGVEVVWSHGLPAHAAIDWSEHERRRYRLDPERLARDFGGRGRSDAAGVVRVPAGRLRTRVIARHHDLYGDAWFGGDGAPAQAVHRLVLERDVALAVRVTGADGAPAVDVPIDLRLVREGGSEWDRPGDERGTDAAGMVVFPHVQTARREPSGGLVAEWRIHVAIPELDVPPLTVATASVPESPVEIRLPPVGSMRLRLTLAGQPVPGLERLILRGRTTKPSWTREVDADGWADFPHLPCGRRFEIERPSGRGPWALAIDGPASPGERVVRELPLEAGRMVGIARFVDATGAPLGRQLLTIGFTTSVVRSEGPDAVPRATGAATESGHSMNGEARTDDAGRLAFMLGDAAAAGARVRLEHMMARTHADRPPIARGRVGSRDLRVGINDLGDIVVAPEAVVCSGRIVLEGGDPARVRFWVQHQVGGEWRDAAGLLYERSGDGVFAVRGEAPRGELRLYVSESDEHLPVPPRSFVAGATELTLVIPRGTRLEATCLLPADADPDHLCLRLVGPAAAGYEADPGLPPWVGPLCARPVHSLDGRNTYRWRALPDGPWTLAVELRGIDVPLVEIADLAMPRFGGDRRLDAIDLRDRVAMLRVDAQDVPALAFPQPQRDDRPWQGFDERSFLVPALGVELLLVARGHRPVRVQAVPPRVAVAMQAWPEVEATVVGIDADSNAQVELAWEPAPARAPREFTTGAEFGPLEPYLQPESLRATVAGGTARLTLGDGVNRLRAFVVEDERRHELLRVTPTEVVAGPPVTVHLQPDEIRASLAALRAAAASRR